MTKQHYKSTNHIRQVFKQAFINAGVPYHSPHTFRHSLVAHGEEICGNPEEFKAWSRNLGHTDVSTTFTSYGKLEIYKQGIVIKRIKP